MRCDATWRSPPRGGSRPPSISPRARSAMARALDDAHYYLVRTRAPWCSRGVTIRDWEALAWTVPAVQLADPPLARELILRTCEIHGDAPGRGVHYFDGTLFEPGFT